MKKTNKVMGFVKNHKKEMLIATAASVVGVVGGIVGYESIYQAAFRQQ